MQCKQNYIGKSLCKGNSEERLINQFKVNKYRKKIYMLIEDKIIEVEIYPQNRKYYQNKLGKELENWTTIEVEQRVIPPSARIEVSFICDVCGVEYEAGRNTQDKTAKNTYCSRGCHKEGKRNNLYKHNPNPPKDKISVKCWTCGEPFEVFPSVYKKQDTFCCSRKCYKERRNKKGFNLLNDETDIERIIREYLESEGIEFKTQESVYPYWCDFYIPKSNLILEVFGDYWHANPKKYGHEDAEDKYKEVWENDVRRANYIINKGYRLEVLWEDTIKNEPEKAKKLIRKYLKND